MIMRAEIFIVILMCWKVDCVDIVGKLFCQDFLNILALNQMLNS